jgi:uncharacterized membrane protein YphA (DoxX/SURF4 family)
VIKTIRSRRSEATLLLTCRFVSGGALLLAGVLKLRNPDVFMLSIKGFDLAPVAVIPYAAYLVPWLEVACGLLLFYGLWARAAAMLATVLYLLFTAAVISAILRGMSLDCGCFGDIFGPNQVGWFTVARNGVFIAAAALVWWRGPGLASMDFLWGSDREVVSARPPKENRVLGGGLPRPAQHASGNAVDDEARSSL